MTTNEKFALRVKVQDLMSEYELTDIMNMLWSEVDSMRISLIEQQETFNEEVTDQLEQRKKESSILFNTWNTISHLVL